MAEISELDQWKERHALCAAGFDKVSEEAARLRERLSGIEAALKSRGLFAFEHIDGTYTINDR